MNRDTFANHLYLSGLCLLAFSLPMSHFLMSVSQFLLGAAWLISGNYKGKITAFLGNKPALFFSGIYLFHLLGMAYTVDFPRGLVDLRIKLPLLILPFVIAGMKPLTSKKTGIVLWMFIAGVCATAIISALMQWGFLEAPSEFRGSAFISHIRFSLMICLAIFILGSFIIKKQYKIPVQILSGLLIMTMAVFLLALKAMTGIIVFAVCVPVAILWLAVVSENRNLKMVYASLAITLILAPCVYVYSSVSDFYNIKDEAIPSSVYSMGGEQYDHSQDNYQMENGYYTWRNIAWKELEQSWNARSELSYDGLDNQGQPLYATLIRFMTSRGLKKDAEGVAQLTQQDIEAIENSISNNRLVDGMSLDDRVYEIIWELHNYRHGANPQGHSVSQRFEFWKAGFAIFKEHPLIGVGTGGAKKAFAEHYDKIQSPLSEEFRLRAHNQYLTVMVTHGIIGLSWFMFAFIYPFFSERKWSDFLYLMFLSIALLSMLNEDTLETQAGVTFVVFFNALLLFAAGRK